jgi:glycosyltransferase involved in cell wall biosynthesis
VVLSNTPTELANRVEQLVLDSALRARMSAVARESAVERDWEEINGQLIESYRAVLDRAAEAERAG